MSEESAANQPVQVRCYGPTDVAERLGAPFVDGVAWTQAADAAGYPGQDPRWLLALRDGLGHAPYLLESSRDGQPTGWLPLSYVSSRLFGRYLVSLPYINSAGPRTLDEASALALIEHAAALADELNVKHLELRQEQTFAHPRLNQALTSKVHMRLKLPSTSDALRAGFKAKLRSQVKKSEQNDFVVAWGGVELLDAFYTVFSRNMRDLGTPVFGRPLFASILRYFAGDAELCTVTLGGQPVAAALLVHGATATEVPSASTLREFNSTNANMYMYWQLLQRAIARGNTVFDFGRSSQDSGTYRFKEQWGALPEPAIWQYYVRRGEIGDVRPESGKFQLAIRVWKRLPVWLANLLGPSIVRGIP